MKLRRLRLLIMASLCFMLVFAEASTFAASETIYENKIGSHDGYDFEFWKDSGNGSMTLNAGGAFSAEWSNINNILFRKGRKFDETRTHHQLGNISINYAANYQPNGNSYLTVYGWAVDPLVEYYIVDSWGSWRPPGSGSKGSVTIDGGVYDIYETTRVNQPSIKGNATFQQYWSVRRDKRTSGTISVSEHFKAWEARGMKMGKMYEVALTVEGYQSSGKANVYQNVLTVGGPSNPGDPGTPGNPGSTVKVEAENMTKGGQYTSNITSPFNGVALYANNDSVKFNHNFTSGTNSFSLRGASNNSNMARVDLKIGGVHKGTFYYGDSSPAVYTLDNVSTGTGNQVVELVVTADDGTWDAFVDYLQIN